MANRIRLTVAVGFSVLVPSFQDAAAAQACASISGVWGDPSGMWQINQDAAGYITGQQTQGGGADTTCPTNEVYSLAGRYLGNGSFTLTGTYTGNKPSLCAASFTQSGTVSGPGCAQAAETWSNSAGKSGSGTMTSPGGCRVPSGETPSVFVRWSTTIDETAAAWWSTSLKQPVVGDMDWGGRTVTETFDNNAVDTCYFEGSKYLKVTQGVTADPVNLASKAGYSD